MCKSLILKREPLVQLYILATTLESNLSVNSENKRALSDIWFSLLVIFVTSVRKFRKYWRCFPFVTVCSSGKFKDARTPTLWEELPANFSTSLICPTPSSKIVQQRPYVLSSSFPMANINVNINPVFSVMPIFMEWHLITFNCHALNHERFASTANIITGEIYSSSYAHNRTFKTFNLPCLWLLDAVIITQFRIQTQTLIKPNFLL